MLEKALRILYNDDASTFEELLNTDGSLTIHERNIQKLFIEMFKSNKLEPALLQNIFTEICY